MSLLEDVFLEDEAGEAQELERIIEGDDNEPRPIADDSDSDENSEKEDEAEEDKRKVDPTKPKRVVKNPRVILNPARLTGPRGIQVIPEHFKDFKFKGKGHEKDDLDLVLKKLEHWAYRLYPKFEFKDCLKKMETLGNKRPVVVHITKIRTDQFMSEDTVVQRDSSDDEPAPQPEEDEFDRLLQQQIDLARNTPAPGSTRKGFETPSRPIDKSLMMPKATSSPSINDEQRERMLRNRQLAEERRLARLKLNNTDNKTNGFENNNASTITEENTTGNKIKENNATDNNISKDENSVHKDSSTVNEHENEITDIDASIEQEENISKAKSNRSNVIDSSDDDDGALIMNESVTVDVHDSHRHDDDSDNEDRNYDHERNENNPDKSDDNINEGLTVNTKNLKDKINQEIKKLVKEINEDIEMLQDDIKKAKSATTENDQVLDDKAVSVNENVSNSNDISVLASKEITAIETKNKNKIVEQDREIPVAEDMMDVDFSDDF